MLGRRRSMEDAITVAPPWMMGVDYAFFTVYDWHGGSKVAEECSKRLHKYLEKHIEKEKKLPEKVEFDWKKVMGDCFKSMDKEGEVGVEGDGEIAAAKWRKDGLTALVPDRQDERERIEALGGRVLNWNGDQYIRPLVISEPEVKVQRRTEFDDFVIIATGDVVSNEVACKVVRQSLDRNKSQSGATEATATLAELAIAKESRDNISIDTDIFYIS
ncbi:probable phosphatase 2C 51 [Olea europaea subsp. europaea]|uniref:Probable phosphatase 2C 51 n=1 Tax=Olea europaea subsp. europaea TaxID=158383 RepID=A0A8S0SS96_OLEEU|nr:probable phosphatase 2C 51 [Olea europaea subsp. europaea]